MWVHNNQYGTNYSSIDELLDGYEKENAEELVADIRKISDEIIEEL